MDVRVKICGIARLEDARLAHELGAWTLGLIQFPGSPRRCPPEHAARIASAMRRKLPLTGVFVNATLDHVVATADELGLEMLQLHGDEGPAYCAAAAHRTGCKVIKAAQVRSQADVRALSAYPTDFHMLDSGAGGTGTTFDWSLSSAHRHSTPLILAGGLTPENVAQGIAAVRPYAVDTASGTEAAPGVKDPDKLERFFAEVARAGEAPAASAGHAA